MKNFPHEAPTPSEATFSETICYFHNENERRAAESVAGLTAAEVNHDPGHGAWSIGALLKHQLDLLNLITNTLKPGSTGDVPAPELGTEGDWNLDAIMTYRHTLADRFMEVFDAMAPEEFMETRPEAYPPRWGEWPVMMRMLRPLLDMSTHIGQVNYARRQLDNPVNS